MLSEPAYRSLRGYTLDPGFSTMLDTSMINETIYRIRWEKVEPGPKGEYFEVIDIDPPSNCFYEPIDLNDYRVMADSGLNPSEGDPLFHQQQVYVTAMKTLQCFEQSLGRKVIWQHRRNYSFDKQLNTARNKRISTSYTAKEKNEEIEKIYREKFKAEYVQRLRLYPHAFRGANAYYTPDKSAVLFGYFQAGDHIDGANLPGGVVFTCLSPDIVAHELTHAVLDSIHPNFMEDTNEDVAAFHEAFADLVALLQRFTIKDLLEHQLARSKGQLDEFNLMGELATQFGSAMQEGHGALRSAIGAKNEKGIWERFRPDPSRYQTQYECHDRGALLVAVIYDAFIRLYEFKTKDLFRIARGNGLLSDHEDGEHLSIDLVKRLSSEAAETARHLLQICIRALDYCPPLDIDFGDYLRALITADLDVAPADNDGYRIALIEAFRAWGIFPNRVNTLSVESLKWSKKPYQQDKEDDAFSDLAEFLKPKIRQLLDIQNRETLAIESRLVQAQLHNFLMSDHEGYNWNDFLYKLGLTRDPLEFEYEGHKYKASNIPLEVHNIRPAYRIGREGRQLEQVVITVIQTMHLEGGQLHGMKYKGGCTIILNMGNDYNVEYTLLKNIRSEHRFKKQADYQLGKGPAGVQLTDGLYDDDNAFSTLNFAKLHFHSH